MIPTRLALLNTRIADVRSCIRQADLLLTRALCASGTVSELENYTNSAARGDRLSILNRTSRTTGGLSALWAAAGIVGLLSQSLPQAHTEELKEVIGGDPGAPISNKSTAQWRVYTNLAQELWQKGDKPGAERYMRRALEEAKKGFGEQDGHVAAACNNLAEIYRNLKEYDKAEPLYLEGLKIMERAYGTRDQRYAMSLHYVAGFYQTRRNFDLSRKYFRLSLQAVEESLGKNHPMYTMVLSSFADTERLADQRAEAIALLLQASEILKNLGPQYAAEALQASSKVGQLQMTDGQTEQGLQTLQSCAAQAESLYTPDSAGYSTVLPLQLEILAEGLQRTGKLTEARDQLYKAMGARKAKGPGAVMLPLTMLSTAEVELKLGDATGERDSYLRAHNLATQLTEKYKRAAKAFVSQQRGRQQSKGWFSKLFQEEESVEAFEIPFALAIHGAKAHKALAKAQEKLERWAETAATLLEALDILDQMGSHKLSADAIEGAIKADQGEVSVPLEQEMQQLQLAVDLLYSVFRLANDDEKATQHKSVMSQVRLLRSRLPGMEGAPDQTVTNMRISGCLAEVWAARNQLNQLQQQINARKKRFFARPSSA